MRSLSKRFLSSSSASTKSSFNINGPSSTSTNIQFHGGGLAAFHRRNADINPVAGSKPPLRHRISSVLTKHLMSHQSTRLQLISKALYIQLDTLNPRLLNYLYHDCRIPRTFQSWFSLTQLHIWMCQSRLRSADSKEGKVVASSLVDHFATDIEMKMWAAGVKNSKTHDRYLHQLLSFHYGCVLAYDEGYECEHDGILASALWRNVYTMSDTIEPVELNRLVHYVRYQMDYIHNRVPFEAFFNHPSIGYQSATNDGTTGSSSSDSQTTLILTPPSVMLSPK